MSFAEDRALGRDYEECGPRTPLRTGGSVQYDCVQFIQISCFSLLFLKIINRLLLYNTMLM